ncbi:DNA-3-methyladenine glycosylase family protein [Solitalea canadensis]|uniref:DNA-3-methyladenine glycosylase II n=1 Tax=Solitalea canadensis (strain ATCC 29591 / DSM 3403 / JCM 21819 / LMG 8368 / NBRC 15130 / NCIMB 12057 / USAM 9D) TaxID=929556 RepID=H8KSL6_SOLCM|nr:DNA glycosylase [Solitalea canadensis]AFD08567.1 3-methyladenine DNA glycosylase/8-oxoguanine DNA glycosylase [Solitalea canadensis DSM 3403]
MSTYTISIPTPPLFSFNECLWFLDRNYDECLHTINGNEVRKALLINGHPLLISAKETEGHLAIDILKGPNNDVTVSLLKEYVADWFDLNNQLDPFYDMLQEHSVLAYMTKDYKGLRLMGIEDMFEAICWCIIGQQINLTFAYKLKRRLVERYGTTIYFEDQRYHLFPHYNVLATALFDELKEMQYSTQKANYIISTAKAFANGEISKERIKSLPGLEEKQKALTNLKGIGIWTANYVLMKTLKEYTCIPHGDIGLLNALANHQIITDRKDIAAINRFFEDFKGWESYLTFYLWRSLAPQTITQ